MQKRNFISMRRIALWSGLITTAMSVAVMPLQGETRDHSHHGHGACSGFIVLANGYAVRSEAGQAMPVADKGHGHGERNMHQMGDKGHGHEGHKGQMAAPHQHLMGYQHGQAIMAGEGELCVPLGHAGDTAWTAVSQGDGWSVAAASLRGELAHNSRANEGFSFAVTAPDGKSLDNAEVQLFVRMPEHDHRMPGGHGPANDPDVTGLPATTDEQGRYRVNTVDFSMPGPWLLQVVVKRDGETLNAYFAANVGEE